MVPEATGVAPRSEVRRTSMEHVAEGIHAGTPLLLFGTGTALSPNSAPILKPLPSNSAPLCAAVGEAIILHYMDDVLVCAPNDDLLSHVLDLTIDSLVAAGFEIQEEKIQRMPPWKYLGLEIGKGSRPLLGFGILRKNPSNCGLSLELAGAKTELGLRERDKPQNMEYSKMQG
ncbi:hypothetical protein DUI87_01876 [Hirundo rustica rustica]|uniref:ribonuclease H n=1 Tax=Hirundo rustica rustica TaxID=333673 RepID=A0A3M0LDB1_HIRRU|nr:hypothetical protein DUI87_01876 [Hirundo rustica rustica]